MDPASEPPAPASGWWLLATGLVMIAAASTWQHDAAGMPRDALPLPAQVVAIETRVRSHPAGDVVLYAPRVRFTRPDGREVTFVSARWTHSVRHLERQPVQVLFDPLTGMAVVDARGEAWSAWLLLGGLGALLLALGVRRLAAVGRMPLTGPGGVTPA